MLSRHDLMHIAAAIALTLFVLIALLTGLKISRCFQIKQLLEDGINIDGVLIRQGRCNRRGPAKPRYYLRYRYIDNYGNEHVRNLMVGCDPWTAHPPGNAIAICYSASKPGVSAPGDVAALARKATQWKKSRGELNATA